LGPTSLPDADHPIAACPGLRETTRNDPERTPSSGLPLGDTGMVLLAAPHQTGYLVTRIEAVDEV